MDTVTHYSGQVLANLQGPGGFMRCDFRLMRPSAGMAGGGAGSCQLPTGTIINAQFPALGRTFGGRSRDRAVHLSPGASPGVSRRRFAVPSGHTPFPRALCRRAHINQMAFRGASWINVGRRKSALVREAVCQRALRTEDRAQAGRSGNPSSLWARNLRRANSRSGGRWRPNDPASSRAELRLYRARLFAGDDRALPSAISRGEV